MRNTTRLWGAVLSLILIGAAVAGCGDDNRTVTKAEDDAANAKRQSFIDNLNIPAAQKAAMKAHMGGSAAGVSQPGKAPAPGAPGYR